MTKKCSYSCDLCSSGQEDGLRGIYWDWTAGTGRSTLKLVSHYEAEHHICKFCLEDIWKIEQI